MVGGGWGGVHISTANIEHGSFRRLHQAHSYITRGFFLSALNITRDCSEKSMGSGGGGDEDDAFRDRVAPPAVVVVMIPRVCWVIGATVSAAVKAASPLSL